MGYLTKSTRLLRRQVSPKCIYPRYRGKPIDPFQCALLSLVPALIESVKPVLLSCREETVALVEIIPENQFWRWKDMWSNSLRTAVFAAVLIEYLSSRKLLSLAQTAEILGSELTFHLTALKSGAVEIEHHFSRGKME
jgi:hypothetical protein